MSTYTEDPLGVLSESQGPFAPETLNPDAPADDVFSRRFMSAEKWIDVYAAPTRLERWDGELTDEYEVTTVTETRDVRDEGGDTSEYEWGYHGVFAMSYDDAVARAKSYIESLSPSDFE